MLQGIIEEGGYSLKQIFSLDETALLEKMVSRTYVSWEEKSALGYKTASDCFMLLLGGNAKGDGKLKPVVVYYSANPSAL
jgi:hypothetical protein